MAQKFEYDMSDKGIYEIYLKHMDHVNDAYGGGMRNDAGIVFQTGNVNSLKGKFRKTIEESKEKSIASCF